jgi:hypothetical protein
MIQSHGLNVSKDLFQCNIHCYIKKCSYIYKSMKIFHVELKWLINIDFQKETLNILSILKKFETKLFLFFNVWNYSRCCIFSFLVQNILRLWNTFHSIINNYLKRFYSSFEINIKKENIFSIHHNYVFYIDINEIKISDNIMFQLHESILKLWYY